VPAGPISAELVLPGNCTLQGENPRTLGVTFGDVAPAGYDVLCGPTEDMLQVVTSTVGDDMDPEGYTVAVNDTIGRSIGLNDQVSFSDLPPGPHTVELMGVPDNCSVAGDNPRTVTIPPDDRATTTFEVTCAPNLGGLEVVTSTAGGDLDPDGYTVVVADTLSQGIGLDDQVTFSPVTPGDLAVHLTDVAANCVVIGDNPRIVSVPFNETVSTTFEIECDPHGDLEVTTSTTGISIPGELKVSVAGAPDGSVGPNETIVFADLPAGEHTVELIDVPPHCEVVGGPNPRTVSVASGFGSTTFVLECWAWLVFDSHRTGSWDIFIMRHDGSGQQNLTNQSADDRQPVVSPDGTRIAFASTRSGTEHIYVMNRDGTGVVQMTHTGQVNKEPSWSPDGSKIVFSRRESSQWDVWMMDAADGSNQVNLTNSPAFDARGEWSPDGTKLLFDSTRDGTRNIYVMDPDGTGVTQLTTNGGANATWSPDGGKITFTSLPPDAEVDIWIMNADGTNQTNLTSMPAAADGESAWSPDGTTIAFASWRDGNYQIYFMDPDGTNPRRITINASDDMWPSWAPIP
jgi:Tol biopolymer transport system component